MNTENKVLIIRLSSFGDILQCLSSPAVLKKAWPDSQVHWVVRSDFEELIAHNPHIENVWSFNKKRGLLAWLQLAYRLRSEDFTHVYDAHSNLRSRLLCAVFRMVFWKNSYSVIRRSKMRFKRFLLFQLGKNLFPTPFKGQVSFLKPLQKWNIDTSIPSKPQLHFSSDTLARVNPLLPKEKFIAIAPSAAWPMKRWPIDYWKQLISLNPEKYFVILGGPDDQFCAEIAAIAPQRTLNLAGQLKLLESCAVLLSAQQVVSADTGLLHAADLLGKKTIALIGPTAFGYPSHPNSHVLETSLDCKPCSKDGRGRCTQDVYQKCMVSISPQMVTAQIVQFDKALAGVAQ